MKQQLNSINNSNGPVFRPTKITDNDRRCLFLLFFHAFLFYLKICFCFLFVNQSI